MKWKGWAGLEHHGEGRNKRTSQESDMAARERAVQRSFTGHSQAWEFLLRRSQGTLTPWPQTQRQQTKIHKLASTTNSLSPGPRPFGQLLHRPSLSLPLNISGPSVYIWCLDVCVWMIGCEIKPKPEPRNVASPWWWRELAQLELWCGFWFLMWGAGRSERKEWKNCLSPSSSTFPRQ